MDTSFIGIYIYIYILVSLGVLNFTTELSLASLWYILYTEMPKVWGCFSTPKHPLVYGLDSIRVLFTVGNMHARFVSTLDKIKALFQMQVFSIFYTRWGEANVLNSLNRIWQWPQLWMNFVHTCQKTPQQQHPLRRCHGFLVEDSML